MRQVCGVTLRAVSDSATLPTVSLKVSPRQGRRRELIRQASEIVLKNAARENVPSSLDEHSRNPHCA